MGTIETQLMLKYGVPLAIKLLANGRVDAANEAQAIIENLDSEGVGEALIHADSVQAESIVEGLFQTVIGKGIGDLVSVLAGLLGIKNES